jgi:hypothetical protein
VEGADLVPTLPPQLRHFYVVSQGQHRVDTLRRCINALEAQRALVFMNFQQRLKDTQFKLEASSMEVRAGRLAQEEQRAGRRCCCCAGLRGT